MSIETIRKALKSYRDFFDPGDEYCTCDPEVGYMCEGCARRKEATDALAALSAIDPEAIEKLKPFLQHGQGCDWMKGWPYHPERKVCTCGLDAILADEPKEREANETGIDFVEPTSRDMQIADEVRMCNLGVGAAMRVAKYRIEVERKLKEAEV